MVLLVEWKEAKYGVHNKLLDSQHQHLFELVNELHQATIEGSAERVTMRILEELKHYTVTHFKDEELAMAEARYPGLMKQQMEHGEFIRHINDFSRAAMAGRSEVAERLCRYLCEWLENHIALSDRKYVEVLR